MEPDQAAPRGVVTVGFHAKIQSEVNLGICNRHKNQMIFSAKKNVANNTGTDQTAWMHRLVCVFDVYKPPKTDFLMSWPT